MFDAHMHTPLCKHAEGSPLEYAQAALEQGLQGICVTDHNPMPAWFDSDFRMRESELPHYLEMVSEAREAMAGKLEVRVGLEADFHPGTEGSVQKVLEAHDWDYVIGSVHFIGAWGFDNPAFVAEYDRRDLEAVYAEYYKLIVAAAQSGLFDAIGHLDLPKKFGHVLPNMLELALPALDAIATAGLALDYNTAGYRKPIAEAYPSPSILSAALERGISIVTGSDAHKPSEVAWKFEDARATLKQIGFSSTNFYRGRKAFAIPL
jgi:histidinol-phosphatase (PHP family)